MRELTFVHNQAFAMIMDEEYNYLDIIYVESKGKEDEAKPTSRLFLPCALAGLSGLADMNPTHNHMHS